MAGQIGRSSPGTCPAPDRHHPKAESTRRSQRMCETDRCFAQQSTQCLCAWWALGTCRCSCVFNRCSWAWLCDPGQHQGTAHNHAPTQQPVTQRDGEQGADEGCESKHRAGPCSTESPLRQQVQAQAQAASGRTDREQRAGGACARKRPSHHQGEPHCSGHPQHGFPEDNLAEIAFCERTGRGVVDASGDGGDPHRKQFQQLNAVVQPAVDHQHPAAVLRAASPSSLVATCGVDLQAFRIRDLSLRDARLPFCHLT